MGSFSALVNKWQPFLLLFFSVLNFVVSGDRSSDKAVLLEFKKSASDPSGLLSTWTETSHHCSWYGVTCDKNSKVLSLKITGFGRGPKGKLDNTTDPASYNCSDRSLYPFYGFGIRRSCGGNRGSLFGNLPASIGKLSELRILSLPFNRFEGNIPTEIWGLEKLEVLDLENNAFNGTLPARISGLKNLRVLNLAFNIIIAEEIPSWLSSLEQMEILNLAGNYVNGTIPGYFGRFRGVYLSTTNMDGSLPADIGESCKLEHLDLSGNLFVGQIPASLGNCSKLRSLLLYGNMFEERIPHEIGRLHNLQVLDVSKNILSGPIPAELGNCSALTVLVLSTRFSPYDDLAMAKEGPGGVMDDCNYYQGGIPDEITKLSKLKVLWAPRAALVGNLPNDWGACDNLEMVNLSDNFFAGEIPVGLSLCKKLLYLDLSSNKRLTGELIADISVPCMSLFDVSKNSLSGSIPTFYNRGCPDVIASHSYSFEPFTPTSAYLSYFATKNIHVGTSFQILGGDDGPVVFHNFGGNNFTGNISSLPIAPQRLGKSVSYAFYAGENLFSGPFPENMFENCNRLGALLVNVSCNMMSGQIPAGIGQICKSLKFLDVSFNQITGPIPPSVADIVPLVSLNLSWNLLQDQIPSNFGKLKDLRFLFLAGNNLIGSIPSTIGQLQSLQILDLSSNSLSGEIPEDLVNLRNLTVLLLNNNTLSGKIPAGLANMTMLSALNLSFNNLSWPLPSSINLTNCSSVLGNPLLRPCKSYASMPSSEQPRVSNSQNHVASPQGSKTESNRNNGLKAIQIALLSTPSIPFILLFVVILFHVRKWNSKSKIISIEEKEVIVFIDIGVPLTFDGVVKATGNFNVSNCVGSGGFGSTYKAEISPGVLVAIKRLAIGQLQGFQQFDAEIKTLGRLRHPNLVTLIGYHASETETFLIYNYLPGGNLEKFIRERSAKALDWRILHKIALDVAHALAYLHDQCDPRILHRDVKPCNILLDDDYNAYLCDFGLARLLETSKTHATTGVAGTFGYVAPDYATTGRVSDKSDVYSYGVVLLELFSDKKALDPSFSRCGDSINIVLWSSSLIRKGKTNEFFTAGLWDEGPQNELAEVLHLAVVCTNEYLSIRPTMKQVVQRLKQLQPPSC